MSTGFKFGYFGTPVYWYQSQTYVQTQVQPGTVSIIDASGSVFLKDFCPPLCLIVKTPQMWTKDLSPELCIYDFADTIEIETLLPEG